MDYTLNCNGRLVDLRAPQVMGILNVTPDSFYADSRQQTEREVVERVIEIISQVIHHSKSHVIKFVNGLENISFVMN